MKHSFTSRLMMALFSLGAIGLILGVGTVISMLFYFGHDLPDLDTLADYKPPIVTRAYASDGRVLAEFAVEKRIHVPIETIPKRIIHAFLSAEDRNFYTHSGVDFRAILRSVIVNLANIGSGRRPVGASTITQQVARNFFLSNEVSYVRKIKEAILAFRLEQAFTKDQLLELYLNQIYLGKRSYGIAAAALQYFSRPLDELSIEEAAYLGALPKAPNNYNPERHYDAALGRRNWVIMKMAENGYISKEEAAIAKENPIDIVKPKSDQYVKYPYFAEEVRRQLQELYGDKGLYEAGLIAHTTIIPEYQVLAEKALRNGLIAYDKRHGLHSKPIAHIDIEGKWHETLGRVKHPEGMGDLKLAVVLKVEDKIATIGFYNGKKAVITYNKIRWARTKDVVPTTVGDVLTVGDVWLTESSGEKIDGKDVYWLRQIPKVQGAIIAMDPHTGRIFASAGGFSYELSQFNRATQAVRQPGSSFKPFVYLTALENGFTPATLVMDAPFVFDQGPGLDKWRPKNYSEGFSGPTPLRIGIEKSRNLMTIRLASYVGMNKVAATAKRFGVVDNLKPLLSMAVGAGETTLYKVVTGYSSFVNGGKKITPTILDRIQDRDGKTIYKHGRETCFGCGPLISWEGQAVPDIEDTREKLADPRHMYQIVSLLEGAVQRGTGISLKDIGWPVAGKTGTTNQSKDTWFIGFTPDIIVGAYVGFDDPKPMGDKETGSRVAAPIVKEFMSEALKDVPPVPFRIPPGIRLVQIDATDGTRATVEDENIITEAFLEGTEPGSEPTMFTGSGVSPVSGLIDAGEGEDTGLGGLY